MSFRVNYGQVYPVNKNELNRNNSSTKNEKKNSFEEILQNTLYKSHKSLKISSHAQKRLDEREIPLSEEDMIALEKAVDQAQEKGAKESLLLYKDMALITSIQNRTIITAMDQNSAKENVFTNIDSAMIVK